jgi:predicted enzyme related to lactoylglutathione lyase
MGRAERYPAGSFCWIDLATRDVKGAAAFYGGVFGWDLEVTERSATARLDGAVVAGISLAEPRTGLSDDGWRSFVRVEDRAAGAALVRRLGGQTSEAGDLVADPAGAAFWLADAGDRSAEVVNEVGAWSWNELVTPDVQAASRFYGELFGWEPQPIQDLARLAWRIGERLIAGAHEPMPGEPPPPRWDVSFRVADVDATVSRVMKLGGAVVLPAIDIPIGRFAVVTDREGVSMVVSSFRQIVGGVDGT